MPTLVTSLQQQEQAAASGFRNAPQLPNISSNAQFAEEFQREALTPTGGYTIYTAAGDGSVTISQGNVLAIASGATIGNKEDARTSGQTFTRQPIATNIIDGRTSLVVDIVFGLVLLSIL